MTATVTVSPGAPEPLCRILLPKISLTSKTADLSARVPGAEYLRDECAGGPRPLCPPGKRHALPDRQPSHHRTRPSPAAPPRETGRAAGGRREMHAQLSRERQAADNGLRGPLSVARPSSRPPSVAVRAKPTVPHTAPGPGFPSAMRPWTPRYDGLQRYKVTHAGTEKKTARRRAFPQLAGRFRRWWQVLGSNQRRLSRRFYRPLLRTTQHCHYLHKHDWIGLAATTLYTICTWPRAAGRRVARTAAYRTRRDAAVRKPAGSGAGRSGFCGSASARERRWGLPGPLGARPAHRSRSRLGERGRAAVYFWCT